MTVTQNYLARLKQLEYRAKYGKDLAEAVKCNFCEDSGVVILKEQVDDALSDFVYRCICNAGQKRKEAWPVVAAYKVMHHRPALFADAE